MGRYYSGDIEGKFWFGVQSSDDASFFGVEPNEPTYLEYTFEKEDLPNIKKGINECIKKLGHYKEKLDNYFDKHNGYSNENLEKYLKIDKNKVYYLLEWYARLKLGTQIQECVIKKEYCSFEAEL